MKSRISSWAPGILEIPLADLKARYCNETSRFIEVDGLDVHYRDEGEGRPLLMLHGILSSLHNWESWTHILKPAYRMISLDLPGHGLTGPANFAYNRENYMRFIAHFLDTLNIEHASVIGNSLGGWFAWNFASEYPHRCDNLILIDTAGFPQPLPLPMWAMTAPLISCLATRCTPRLLASMLLRQVFAKAERIDPAIIDRYYAMQLRPGNRKASQSLFRYAATQNRQQPSGLERLKMPALLMWGKQDRWIPANPHLTLWQQALPHAEIICYEDAGHMPMEETPLQSALDAQTFLDKQQCGSADK